MEEGENELFVTNHHVKTSERDQVIASRMISSDSNDDMFVVRSHGIDLFGSGGGVVPHSCPICRSVIHEAFMTSCGHSFCYSCLTLHLSSSSSCPVCRREINREIYPNFVLNDMVARERERERKINEEKYNSSEEIDMMILRLMERKKRIEMDDKEMQFDVVQEFLVRSRAEKAKILARIKQEVEFIDTDLGRLSQARSALGQQQAAKQGNSPNNNNNTNNTNNNTNNNNNNNNNNNPRIGAIIDSGNQANKRPRLENNTPIDHDQQPQQQQQQQQQQQPMDRARHELLQGKKRRVLDYFKDLQAFYYNCRRREPIAGRYDPLQEFCNSVTKLTQFSRWNVCATLKYGDILTTASNIVSCIDFDKDGEYFATGGVAKKIKIFDYESVVNPASSAHYPIHEMACESKISCLSWNPYIKSHIASSDYEGIVTVWDASRNTSILRFEEHEKRTWCVDFSPMDPMRLASGSDDTRVKIWSLHSNTSVMTIDSKANVCCVKFNPFHSNQIVFGSADHNVHFYDLRNTAMPVCIYKGHKKAVSYVKFLNEFEFVSASTDSSLKLWTTNMQQSAAKNTFGNTTAAAAAAAAAAAGPGGPGGPGGNANAIAIANPNGAGNNNPNGPGAAAGMLSPYGGIPSAAAGPSNGECLMTFTGHINEKNFVGLSCNTNEYIACGSETNSVFTYYKNLNRPVLIHHFKIMNMTNGEEISDDQPAGDRGGPGNGNGNGNNGGAGGGGAGAGAGGGSGLFGMFPDMLGQGPFGAGGAGAGPGADRGAAAQAGNNAANNTSNANNTGNQFVSAVCWKKSSNILVAANSQGIIKVLEMV